MGFICEMQAEQISCKKKPNKKTTQLKIVAFKSMGLFTYKWVNNILL